MRIVFMGTPDFAVASLDALVKADFQVVAVITAPDRPAGRGRKIQQSAVKKYAVEHQIPTLQPTNLKDPNFVEELRGYKADLQVVVAFRMLPKEVWQMPKYRTFNLHASLLPEYRGAAPINWAIINGETKTGVTTFFIDEKIDTGTIILQEETTISPTETVGELHDRLMEIGSKLVVKTVTNITNGNVKTTQQPEKDLKPAPKLFPETCKIDWEQPLNDIYNLIRGLNPYPTAWTYIKGNTKLKLFDVEKHHIEHQYSIGTIFSENKQIFIALKDGLLEVKSLQMAGKKRMDAKSFLNGYQFEENEKVG